MKVPGGGGNINRSQGAPQSQQAQKKETVGKSLLQGITSARTLQWKPEAKGFKRKLMMAFTTKKGKARQAKQFQKMVAKDISNMGKAALSQLYGDPSVKGFDAGKAMEGLKEENIANMLQTSDKIANLEEFTVDDMKSILSNIFSQAEISEGGMAGYTPKVGKRMGRLAGGAQKSDVKKPVPPPRKDLEATAPKKETLSTDEVFTKRLGEVLTDRKEDIDKALED